MTKPKPKETQPDLLGMKDVTPKPTKEGLVAAAAAVEADGAAKKRKSPEPKTLPQYAAEKAAAKKAAAKKEVAVHQPRAPKVPAANDNPNMLAVIARAAADPNVNVEKMQSLLNMQKEIVAEEARMASITAFIALQDELPSIGRDGKIEIKEKSSGRIQQTTPYASFNAIMLVLKPLLKKHGFGLHFETEPMPPLVVGESIVERIIVRGVLAHNRGHVRTTSFPLPMESSGSKNPVQGWGSSMSYGKRYATIALVNILSEAPEDRDTDGNPNKETLKPLKGGGFADVEERAKISKAQGEALLKKIDECGVPLAGFHMHYEIDRIGDLPADLFDAAIKRCDEHKKKKAANRG